MKTLLAAALTLSLASSVLGAELPKPAPKSAEAKAANKQPALEKGTAAADILKRFGQPAEVVPMTSPDPAAHAERWIYRRKADEKIRQDHVSDTREVHQFTSYTANGTPTVKTVVISTPVYKTKVVTTYQVTALLMVNSKLELAKQWKEEREEF